VLVAPINCIPTVAPAAVTPTGPAAKLAGNEGTTVVRRVLHPPPGAATTVVSTGTHDPSPVRTFTGAEYSRTDRVPRGPR